MTRLNKKLPKPSQVIYVDAPATKTYAPQSGVLPRSPGRIKDDATEFWASDPQNRR